jgi:ribonuclease Y
MFTIIIAAVIAAGVGGFGGYWYRNSLALKGAGAAEKKAKEKLEEAERKAKEIVLEAKDKAASVISTAEKEESKRKSQVAEIESRLLKREEFLDEKLGTLTRQEEEVRREMQSAKQAQQRAQELRAEAEGQIEKVAGMTAESAKEALFAQLRDKYQEDLALTVQKLYKERRDDIEKKGTEIIAVALQRYARSHVSELTTTVFQLGDEDLKGKIIGREGRNIRAIERATGVELIVDETPDTIVISSFDPYRREVARLSLEKLIKDGRIQPAKVEEKVEEAKQELNKRMYEIGEAAATEVGVYDLPKELITLLGRLNFRTSFGQNVLTHSIEMAYVSAMIAGELGLNVTIARKGALLHDIGKAIDHEVEGTHVDLGMKILRKYEVEEAVIDAMRSHHDDYPYASPEAYVVTAADVLSAGRPGARRGTLENYIRRLADLEKIAYNFPGVKNAYAISAGRELRVFVVPEKIDDFRALELAREIANRIQSELKYPGEIKVNVIRETRAVEFAR